MNEEAGGENFRRPSCLQIDLLRIIEPPEGSFYCGVGLVIDTDIDMEHMADLAADVALLQELMDLKFQRGKDMGEIVFIQHIPEAFFCFG